jgi:Protein of unknown function (DUF3035)
MHNVTKTILRLTVIGLGAVSLMGCQAFREAAGLSKTQPDEFAIATKAPLIIPPDYNLRPPRDGAPPTNQVGPTDVAQSALFDNDPTAAAKLVQGDYSQGEKLLLAQANAVTPDPSIRQQVAADGRAMEAADDTFTQKVLFWKDPAVPGNNVDADAEAKRVGGQKAAGVAGDKKPAGSATISKDDDPRGQDDSSSHSGMWSWWPF